MKDVITKEHLFDHPIDMVWKAISRAEEISTWFIHADFKAEKGYHYTFTAGEEQGCTQVTGVVLEANPYTLSYTWIVQNTDTETTVTWNLKQDNKGTRLVLTHSGISNYPEKSAINMFNNFTSGWEHCISELTAYLKKAVHAR